MTPRERFTASTEALWIAALDLTDANLVENYLIWQVGGLIPADRRDELVARKVPEPTLFDGARQ